MDTVRAAALRFEPVGSRRTCVPPPTDTDDDYLVLVLDHTSYRVLVLNDGFEIGGSVFLDARSRLSGADRFSSYIRNEVNLIVTMDAVFFEKFMAATYVAKRFNLLNKEDRIALFQAVLYSAYDK
jgi:hypothetical protein